MTQLLAQNCLSTNTVCILGWNKILLWHAAEQTLKENPQGFCRYQ